MPISEALCASINFTFLPSAGYIRAKCYPHSRTEEVCFLQKIFLSLRTEKIRENFFFSYQGYQTCWSWWVPSSKSRERVSYKYLHRSMYSSWFEDSLRLEKPLRNSCVSWHLCWLPLGPAKSKVGITATPYLYSDSAHYSNGCNCTLIYNHDPDLPYDLIW